MEELKVKRDKVLEASKSCPDAERVLKTLFPEVFEPNKVNVTEYCSAELYKKRGGIDRNNSFIKLCHNGHEFAWIGYDFQIHFLDSRYSIEKGIKGASVTEFKIMKLER